MKTNFDKLLEDPESKEIIINFISEQCCVDVRKMNINAHMKCEDCKFDLAGCDQKIFDWLHKEYVEGGEG